MTTTGETTGDRRGAEGLDESLARKMRETRQRLTAQGMSSAEISELLTEALDKTLTDSTPRIVTSLFQSAPTMLSEHRRADAQMRRRIRDTWGEALDIYRMTWVSAHELGSGFSTKHQEEGVPLDPLLNALLGLQARTLRVASEVFVLLENGLGPGALGRARTAHEGAVISYVLTKYATEAGHEDIAQRYLDHSVVTSYKDALQYQAACSRLDYPPFEDEYMAQLKTLRDGLVKEYGRAFKQPNGWAAGLVPKGIPSFRTLEELVGLDHLRPFYTWSSHEVHSGPKSWTMNTREWKGVKYRDTGPTLTGLADPANMTLIATLQTTTNLLSGSGVALATNEVLGMKVLTDLIDRAQDAFLEAHSAVELSGAAESLVEP